MGVAAAISAIATWAGASAATAATVGAVGSAALAVGGGAMALKAVNKKGDAGGAVPGSTVMGPQTPGTTKKEEDVDVGSGRGREGGRMRGRRQLMAPQAADAATQAPTAGSQALRV